jgi:hypothetical protein
MTLRRGALLVGAGLVTEMLYLSVALRLSWWQYGMRLNTWSEILGEGQASMWAVLAGLLVLMVAYACGWYAVSGWRADPRRSLVSGEGSVLGQRALSGSHLVWGGVLLFALTLFWLMPITSDLFAYLCQSYLLTDVGVSPLLRAPLDVMPDRLVQAYLTAYAGRASAYGPAWVVMSAPGTMGPFDVAAGLFYLKGMLVVAFLGCAWLLERILKIVRAEAALEGLYLFAWNPLVLLMAVGDGHNDIVMMAGVLLAFWLVLHERWSSALVALALSAWIKYVSAIFLAPLLLYTWRNLKREERWPVLGGGALAVAGISILVLLPTRVLESSTMGPWRWITGVVERLIHPSNWQGDRGALPAQALTVGALLFAAVSVVLLWRSDRQRGSRSSLEQYGAFRHMADVSFVMSLLLFAFGAARSQPWHVIWPASLAGLSGRRWAWPAIIGLSALMLGVQVWVEWGAPGWRLGS